MGVGKCGHIGLSVTSVKRAVRFFESQGFELVLLRDTQFFSGEFFGFFSSFFGGDSGLSFFFFAFLSGFFFEVDDARFDIFFALQLRLHFGLSQFSFFDFVLLGEDSLLGFEISALGGAPGVHSARFAGVHGDDAANNAKMVAELRQRGEGASAADYRCALVFEDTDGTILTADGRVDGTVRLSPRGEGGFGYDPYFYVPRDGGEEKTMAELTLEEKDEISHRGRALRELVKKLEEYFG